MQVTFWKLTEQRITYWEAVRPKGQRVPGSAMALGRGGLPHDLSQMVVEAVMGLDRAFWGSVASGATFRSTGRKRTRPGRAVIHANKQSLDAAEQVAGEQVRWWARGEPGASSDALNAMDRRWRALPDGHGLIVEWPSLRDLGMTDEAPAIGRRRTRARTY
jgi:hypothetical protein